MSKISYRRNIKTSCGGLRAESEPVSACEKQDEQKRNSFNASNQGAVARKINLMNSQKLERVS
jgi:hypothetical protein